MTRLPTVRRRSSRDCGSVTCPCRNTVMDVEFETLVSEYKADPESVYNTWFVEGEQRLKAFRSIKRGVLQCAAEVRDGRFGCDFKRSSLEFVLNAIVEQKQVFDGAAHAFYWKPKLRIPDIYENGVNKRAFGRFLENCVQASTEDKLIREIASLAALNIKGLGPAVANILYFLHPTVMPPCNTAMIKGFNLLFDEGAKLGSWESYLHMRQKIMSVNHRYRHLLSTDLGAICGLLFEVGQGRRFAVPDFAGDADLAAIEGAMARRHREVLNDEREQSVHAEMQHQLLRVGRALGYDVWVASNDHSRVYSGERLAFHSLATMPEISPEPETQATIRLIDVLWLTRGSNTVACAFEVEKSTSIYSGILRLADLAITAGQALPALYLVVPAEREKETVAQLRRPALSGHASTIKYIVFPNSAHTATPCADSEQITRSWTSLPERRRTASDGASGPALFQAAMAILPVRGRLRFAPARADRRPAAFEISGW